MWNCLWQSEWSPTFNFSQKYRVVFWHEAHLRYFSLSIQYLIASYRTSSLTFDTFLAGGTMFVVVDFQRHLSYVWTILCRNSCKSNLRSPWERFCCQYSWYALFTDRSRQKRKTGYSHFLARMTYHLRADVLIEVINFSHTFII